MHRLIRIQHERRARIRIRIDGENVSLIQSDPITGVKNWIVIEKKELELLIQTLEKIRNGIRIAEKK